MAIKKDVLLDSVTRKALEDKAVSRGGASGSISLMPAPRLGMNPSPGPSGPIQTMGAPPPGTERANISLMGGGMPDFLSGPGPTQNAEAKANSAALGQQLLAQHLSSRGAVPDAAKLGSELLMGRAFPGVTPTSTTPAPAAPVSAPAPVQTTGAPQPAAPVTNPLPSSTAPGLQASSYTKPAKVDWNAIRSRAGNDANLQIQALRDQALRNFGRFKSEGGSQIDSLHNLYAPAYKDNEINTTANARNAVQGAANRGFLSSGLAADADLQAKMAGERERMRMQGQENSQVGDIQNRINLSNQELGDMLQSLTGQEGKLTQSLMDSYGKDERQFDLQNRGLSSDIALRMLGMDQSYNQFNQGLAWDKDKFGQQIKQTGSQFDQQMQYNKDGRQLEYGDRGAQRQWQTGESQAQRDWSAGQNQNNQQFQGDQAAMDRQNRTDLANLDAKTRTSLQASEQAWRSGEANLDRADASTRQQIENGLKIKWEDQRIKLDQAEFQFRKDESAQDRTLRTQAATSQWMSFADQALQSNQWKSYNDAVKALDSFSGRITADGVDMIGIHDYIKKRMGASSAGSESAGNVKTMPFDPSMIPVGQAGNTNKMYPYFPDTNIRSR